MASLTTLCPAGTTTIALPSKVTGRLECATSTLPLDCRASSTSSKETGLVPKALDRRMRTWPPQMSGRKIKRKVWSDAPRSADGRANLSSGCAVALPTG